MISSWLIVLFGVLIFAGEVAAIYLYHRWYLWVKRVELPWVDSLSRFVNPEKR